MGASKRLAEVFLQAFAREHGGQTRFVAVRFGNVLGSSGSVVPIFERQIAEGGPITVTHPEVVRFFMTITEAVGLVLQSCAQGQGGEIFVLDLGKPVRIVELARQMVRLSGLQPDRDIEIKFTGLQPGEKLFEELQNLRANCVDTSHPRLKRLTSEPSSLKTVRAQLSWLKRDLHSATPDDLKAMLKRIVPEYTAHFASLAGEKAEDRGRIAEGDEAAPGDPTAAVPLEEEAKAPTQRLVMALAEGAEHLAPAHRQITASTDHPNDGPLQWRGGGSS
jgi:FlaA1/EpsC-like NDP-sugar epimerase